MIKNGKEGKSTKEKNRGGEMKVFQWGHDIYNRVNTCNMCGCVFQTNRNDAIVFWEDNICKCFVECPSCHILILMGVSTQWFTRRGDKNE